MSPSQENSRECLQQAIDAKIKSLEKYTRTLRLRRNALSPISSLPPEVFANIFSLLCLPALEGAMSDHRQPEVRVLVSHVCHKWREIAINQPLLWSNVDLTALSSAGVTEILSRAKSVPLYLEANVPPRHWDYFRFRSFQKALRACVPYVCHLTINAHLLHLRKALGGLESPAPALEYLSLLSSGGYQNTETGDQLFVPKTLFNGVAPRLSCLKLFNCAISWKSPFLKVEGLRHLEIRSPIARPKLAAWLDALDAMSQLKTLVLHSASPITPQDDVNHIATLPFLTHLDILASPADCALALAHLDLPALTGLNITVAFLSGNRDIQALLPQLMRHAHGPQDTQPLQSMLLCNEDNRANIFAWTLPDIDAVIQEPPTFLATLIPSPRVAVFFTCRDNLFITDVDVFYEAMAALPLSGLVTLLAQAPLSPRCWLRLAPKWPLLRRVQLAAYAQPGFQKMLLEGSDESPPLPLLTEIALVGILSYHWASALRKRVKQGVPLERLDLRMCITRDHDEVPLLSEVVVDVLGPKNTSAVSEQVPSRWDPVAWTPFREPINFKAEDNSYTYDSSEDRVDGENEDH